jgi:Flp pilus assembly protein TadG
MDGVSKLYWLCRSSRLSRRGTAAVEFAVVAPLLMLLVFGMVEYGRLVMVQQVLTNASREGARTAILAGSNADSVQRLVVDYCEAAGVRIVPSDVQIQSAERVTLDPAVAVPGVPVRVVVGGDFRDVSWLPVSAFLGDRMDRRLSAETVMRKEGIE